MWNLGVSRKRILLVLEGIAVSVTGFLAIFSLLSIRNDDNLAREYVPLVSAQAPANHRVLDLDSAWQLSTVASSWPLYGSSDTEMSVALSYDTDTADPNIVNLLDVLKENDQKASFFVTAPFIRDNPEAFQRILREGHSIHNHTKTHPKLTELQDYQICEELDAVEAMVQEYGTTTKPYFRPPYGIYDQRVLVTASICGYRAALWTIDPFDWYPGKTVDEVADNVMENLHPGAIILMHCRNDLSAPATKKILASGRRKGYDFVTIDELAE